MPSKSNIKIHHDNETGEQRKRRLAKHIEYKKIRRDNETKEQRSDALVGT